MHANDLNTFIKNRGYHLEEKVKMSKMTSRLAIKTHRRPPFFAGAEAATLRAPPPSNNDDWATVKLRSTISDPFEPSRPECAA